MKNEKLNSIEKDFIRLAKRVLCTEDTLSMSIQGEGYFAKKIQVNDNLYLDVKTPFNIIIYYYDCGKWKVMPKEVSQ